MSPSHSYLKTRGPLIWSRSADRHGQIRIHDLGADSDPVLRRKREANAPAAHRDVPSQKRGHAVGPVADVALGADPEPPQLDQAQGDRRDTFAIEFLLVEVKGHRLPKRRQRVAEADQLVVLGALLLGSKVRAVEVLLPAGGVDARRL